MKKNCKLLVCFVTLLGLSNEAAHGKTISNANDSECNIASLSKRNAPLSFIENKGQVTDQNHISRSDIQFKMSAANGLNIFIGNGAIHYQFNHVVSSPGEKKMAPASAMYDMYRMDVELNGANKHAKVIMEQKQEYYENRRITGSARAYDKITYKGVYPHIDWVLSVNNNGQFEQEFVVRKGGRVSDIQLKYCGAKDLKIDARGDLVASTPQGVITENAPCAYQKDGKKIASTFKLHDNVLSYETGRFDGDLIIDPTLEWATYYGGTDYDEVNGAATDRRGNVYITGRTYSTSDIATSGGHQATFGGYADAFLVKFDGLGKRKWATYYGGSDFDEGLGVATDGDGNVYMTGQAWSTSGIATSGAYQPAYGGNGNAFLVKFNSSGVRQWGTYFGINGATGNGVATDRWGDVYMTGSAITPGIASPGAYQITFGGIWDAFLVKFSSSGIRKWATYYGGSGIEFGQGVATDWSGDVYIGGLTSSTSAIASSCAFQHTYGGGSYDFFLAKFNGAGERKWGTYYGGSGDDQGYGIATDGHEVVYITGISTTPGLATCGAYQPNYQGSGYNALLVKFDKNGERKWATYYGGNGASGSGVATDCSGNVYMTGSTFDTSGIATCGAYQTDYAGSFDAYLVKFSSWGNRLWGTYFGGSNNDEAHCVATDNSGNVYIGGVTNSTSGIATRKSYQGTMHGVSDGFLANFGRHDDHDHDCDNDHGHDHHGWKSAGNVDNDNNSVNTADAVKVFPNPSEGTFSVIIPVTESNAEIMVTDLAGKIIETRSVTNNHGAPVQFNLGNISAGMYLVKITAGINTTVVRLIEK